MTATSDDNLDVLTQLLLLPTLSCHEAERERDAAARSGVRLPQWVWSDPDLDPDIAGE